MNIYNNICTSSIKILYSFEHGSYSTDGFVHHFSGLDMHQETKKGFIETFITRQSIMTEPEEVLNSIFQTWVSGLVRTHHYMAH